MNKVDEVPVPTFWLEEAINKCVNTDLRLDLGRNRKQVWLEPQKIANSHSNLEEEEQRLIILQRGRWCYLTFCMRKPTSPEVKRSLVAGITGVQPQIFMPFLFCVLCHHLQ